MRVTEIEITETPAGARLSADVVWDRAGLAPDRIQFVYRDLPGAMITAPGDALAACMALPAMAVGEDVHVEAPVSRRLLAGIEKVVRINSEWHPKLHRIRVHAPPTDRSDEGPGEVASYFSGGLDSFYTILRPRNERIGLVFTIVGFDLRFEKRAAVPSILPRLERAMEALGRRMVVVDSNAYEIGHKYLVNAEHHGAFLAAVVLAFGGFVRRCYVPSSWTLWRDLPPWGSHPATDPLWSTEGLEFIHDGVEKSRVDKGLTIGENQTVLETLRVCVRRPDLYNCGRCNKCVSTALNLHIAGTLERCSTLGPLDARVIRRAAVGTKLYESVYRDLLEHIEEPELRKAMRQALRLNVLNRAADPILDIVRRRRLRARIRAFEADKGAN